MTMTLELLKAITIKLNKKADVLEEEAALSGEMSDRGASDIRYSLAMYTAGFHKSVPHQYFSVIEETEKEKDIEYTEYLRLKNKFKD